MLNIPVYQAKKRNNENNRKMAWEKIDLFPISPKVTTIGQDFFGMFSYGNKLPKLCFRSSVPAIIVSAIRFLTANISVHNLNLF